ncbi:VOC family protein [Maribacter sp. 2308TA10-17]|uniref:VOC family protein n=1 Tax=Maribacter sp. 2308TA10-17 TaxID=3386276 RepID=UPI0039BCEC2C
MKIERTGLILYVNKYEECLSFYKDILELAIHFQNDELCCFNFYGTYLMVEKDDRSEYLNLDSKHVKNFTCLRLNLANVREAAEWLAEKNIEVDYQEHSWGKVAKFKDPDGNLIAFKDEVGFLKQVEDFKSN